MSASLNKRDFKDLGPNHKPIYWLLSFVHSHVRAHRHTPLLCHFSYVHRPPLSLQAGASQSAGEAKSSLLVLFCCMSALFQLNENLSLATPKTPDFAVESITYQIKSEPQCIPPQTPACSHCSTVLIKLNNTQSSVLLLSKVGLCFCGRSRDFGCQLKETGKAGRRW